MEFNFQQFQESKFWSQAFTEFFGTIALIVVACNGGATAWAWAISYVVITTAFGGHLNPAVTVYKIAEMKHLDPVKGVFWVFAQMLGAYVTVHVSTALGFTQDTAVVMDIKDWQSGLQCFIAVVFFLWFYNESKSGVDGMPSSIFLVLSIVASFWLGGDACLFAWSRGFTQANIAGFWVAALWSSIAAAFTAFLWGWWHCEKAAPVEEAVEEKQEEA